jgi:hypothetical protein
VADSLAVDRSPLQVPAAGHAEATFRVPATAQTVSVVLSERDILPAGDRVDMVSYTRWARRATIVSDAPANWEHVLSAVPNLTTRSIRPQDLAQTADIGPDEIVLLDNVVPSDLPKSPLILVNPPDTSAALTRLDTVQRQRRAVVFDPEDPLLLGLDIAPLNVQQLERAVIPDWAAASVGAEDTPLIMHGHLADQRAVMFAFDPNKSNLPHLTAFPLLMANAVDWLTPGREAVLRGGLNAKTNIQPHALADIAASGVAAPQPSLAELWPWLVAVGGLFFLFEWAVAVRRG